MSDRIVCIIKSKEEKTGENNKIFCLVKHLESGGDVRIYLKNIIIPNRGIVR